MATTAPTPTLTLSEALPAGPSPALELDEAVQLCYAVIDRVARLERVRVLAIKGPVADFYGLRERGQSVDVDALVDPAAFDYFCDRVADLGWRRRVRVTAPQILPLHSQTVSHAAWPCEVDLHRHFPGFFAPREAVFEALWRQRKLVPVAGVALTAAGYVDSVAIQALHLLRDGGSRQAEFEALVATTRAQFSEVDRDAFARLAIDTGSQETLSPLLSALGIPAQQTSFAVSANDLALWKLRQRSEAVKAVPALHALRAAPWYERPRVLWRVIMLTEPEIRERQPAARPGANGLLAARLRRLGWGLRALPKAIGVILSSKANK